MQTFNTMGLKDKKSIDRIQNSEHNDWSGTKKVSFGGDAPYLIFGNNSATAQLVDQQAVLRCVNTDTVVQYIGVGDSSIGVPSITTGLALPPGQVVYANTGDQLYFRTSSNLVQVAWVKDV